jgi:hypothetical protein
MKGTTHEKKQHQKWRNTVKTEPEDKRTDEAKESRRKLEKVDHVGQMPASYRW